MDSKPTTGNSSMIMDRLTSGLRNTILNLSKVIVICCLLFLCVEKDANSSKLLHIFVTHLQLADNVCCPHLDVKFNLRKF